MSTYVETMTMALLGGACVTLSGQIEAKDIHDKPIEIPAAETALAMQILADASTSLFGRMTVLSAVDELHNISNELTVLEYAVRQVCARAVEDEDADALVMTCLRINYRIQAVGEGLHPAQPIAPIAEASQ